MQLVDLPLNPIPPGALLSYAAVDRLEIRVVRWAAIRHGTLPCPGTIVICPGRAEFIEKYAEVVGELLRRGFAVTAFDWRGQGGSSRPLGDRRKGHVDSFADYARDLDAVVDFVLRPFCPKPWFALAHSMGATVVLHHARRDSVFARMVLSAPMIAISRLQSPRWASVVATAAVAAGCGRVAVPGSRRRSALPRQFERNVLTSDPRRYAVMTALLAAAPELGNGAPTWGWLHAAFRAMRVLAQEEVPRRITTPTLVIAPVADRVVDVRSTERFAVRLKAGQLVTVPRAEHEILMERDEFRDQFWSAFDAFVPGSTVTGAQVEPTSGTAG